MLVRPLDQSYQPGATPPADASHRPAPLLRDRRSITVTHDEHSSGEALWGALDSSASRSSASRVALICPDEGSPITLDELAAIVEELAGRLHTLGVRRGDR